MWLLLERWFKRSVRQSAYFASADRTESTSCGSNFVHAWPISGEFRWNRRTLRVLSFVPWHHKKQSKVIWNYKKNSMQTDYKFLLQWSVACWSRIILLLGEWWRHPQFHHQTHLQPSGEERSGRILLGSDGHSRYSTMGFQSFSFWSFTSVKILKMFLHCYFLFQ